jgi:hypothetical protein
VGHFAVLGGWWLLGALAVAMLVVAVASAARVAVLFAGRGPRRARAAGPAVVDDAALVFMAVATAGMLAPGLRTLPATGWEAVFAALTAWFAVRSARAARHPAGRSTAGAAAPASPGCVPHLVHCAAMLYMFLALPAAPGAGGMTMPAMAGPAALLHVLAVLGALAVLGFCARDVGHLSARRYRLAGAVPVTGALASQASRVGCRAVMGVTMAVMLVIMT